MNKWQERFAQKIEAARGASKERFERLAAETLIPAFDEYKEFTSGQGFQAVAPLSKGGLRTFRFSVAENAYVLLTFRLVGLEHAEVHIENAVPHHAKIAPTSDRVELNAVNETWLRRKFEQALDTFVEAYVEALNQTSENRREPVGAR